MLGLLAKIPLRLYEYAGLALAIVLFVLWWDHTEIEKGRAEIRKEIAVAQAKAQASIDAAADAQNAKIQAQFNAHNYTPIDYTLPPDCNGKVPDAIRDAVNKAHQ
jgi:hypothetical protein